MPRVMLDIHEQRYEMESITTTKYMCFLFSGRISVIFHTSRMFSSPTSVIIDFNRICLASYESSTNPFIRSTSGSYVAIALDFVNISTHKKDTNLSNI